MANAGKDTNGSQCAPVASSSQALLLLHRVLRLIYRDLLMRRFFLCTVPCAWLDGKHGAPALPCSFARKYGSMVSTGSLKGTLVLLPYKPASMCCSAECRNNKWRWCRCSAHGSLALW